MTVNHWLDLGVGAVTAVSAVLAVGAGIGIALAGYGLVAVFDWLDRLRR